MTAGRRKDLVLGASAAAIAAATTAVRFAADPGQDVGAASIAGSALIGAALGVGRWRPRAGWLLAVAGLLLGAVDGGVLLVPYALAMLQAFEAGRRETRSAGVCAVAAIVAASLVGAWVGHDSAAPFLFLAPAVWGAGRALRERELVAARLAERARELEEEREAYAQLSVRYERARIAAELHDIVAHAISVMVVQAGAGQRLVTVDPALTAEAFEAIADSARQAEQDMGRLVALLSDDEAIGPAPDLALVEELVGRAAGSGLDVALRLEGDREGLPAAAVEAAYRVVQESLTNALRYASGAAVRVLVRGSGDGVLVEVANGPAGADASLAGAGTGNGLRGLRERVDAAGGSFDAGPVPGGGWQVSARLPRRVAAPA